MKKAILIVSFGTTYTETRIKKAVVSTKEAEKPETISVTEEKKKTAKGSVHINEELPVYLL